jgi:UV DNA damage endonuclease
MRLGYACINTGLPTPARTVRLANATPRRLAEVLALNLDALARILRWNLEHRVEVFRLSSNIVPLATHPAVRLDWQERFADRFAELGQLASSIRLSTHPGPYTVLGSADPRVAAAACVELQYHCDLLRSLGTDTTSKIVVHLGGGGGDRAAWKERVIRNARRLPPEVRERLAFEHDERWSLLEALDIAAAVGVPVVFDAFHHQLQPSLPDLTTRQALNEAARTWTAQDGRPEVHFSTQAPGRRPGAHAETIDIDAFLEFAAMAHGAAIDCTLEVKDKEQSLLRARGAVARSPHLAPSAGDHHQAFAG